MEQFRLLMCFKMTFRMFSKVAVEVRRPQGQYVLKFWRRHILSVLRGGAAVWWCVFEPKITGTQHIYGEIVMYITFFLLSIGLNDSSGRACLKPCRIVKLYEIFRSHTHDIYQRNKKYREFSKSFFREIRTKLPRNSFFWTNICC